MFCFALQVASWWQRPQSLTKEKETKTDRESDKVEIKEEKLFVLERTPLFYTKASGYYEHNPRRKELNHTSIVAQAGDFW